MAKSEAPAVAGRTAVELKSELRRLVRAITDEEEEDGGGAAPLEAYEQAYKALASLMDIRLRRRGGGVSDSSGGRRLPSSFSPVKMSTQQKPVQSTEIPDHFLCPISSELMRDPVVLASGQTYDRPFIQEWLNSGNRTCPQTQQVLSDFTLTPNHLIRSMISQWCGEQGIILPQKNHDEDHVITGGERDILCTLLGKVSCSSIPEQKKAVRELRLLTKRNRSFRALLGENPESIPKLLSVLSVPGLNDDQEVQEDTVTTILNLSIHESNKKIIGENPQAIPLLIQALSSGTIETRSNSAAALFSLSALDSNKTKIGELGAMKHLVELLKQGSTMAKKDAASAIFNLCMAHENKARAVMDGAVSVTLMAIMDRSLVDESLAILALLSSNQDAVEEICDSGGLPFLLSIIRESSCGRNRENAAVVLFSICMSDRTKLREVGEEETLNGTLSQLAQNGTSRARRKATGILERLRRMHITYHSC